MASVEFQSATVCLAPFENTPLTYTDAIAYAQVKATLAVAVELEKANQIAAAVAKAKYGIEFE